MTTIITIACPTNMEHPEINKDTAPIWIDAKLNEYYVASGIIENVEPTEHTVAVSNKITIIGGQDGLSALSEMGLVVKPSIE